MNNPKFEIEKLQEQVRLLLDRICILESRCALLARQWDLKFIPKEKTFFNNWFSE